MFPASPLLLADLFDRFRLQLPDPIVNWLTPVWILCVGASLGLILTAAIWGVFWLLSRIPGVGTLAENPTRRWIAIVIATVILFGVFAALYTYAANQPPSPLAPPAVAQAAA